MPTYMLPFALLRNHHRVLFTARDFPTRNLGRYAKALGRFSGSVLTFREFSECIVQPNPSSFVHHNQKHA